MIKIKPQEIQTPKLSGLLAGAIGPRPIAFASTVDADGNPNLSPFSYFNMFSANPPILVFSAVRRVRNNTTKHTFHNVEATKEVVINVVNYDMVQQASLASTEYPDGVNEFVKSGFTPIESELVKPFRVKESPVQLECKVNEIIELGQEGGSGTLIVCEVVMIHIDESILDEDGAISPQKIDLVSRLGGNWYARANGDALFEVEKPLRNLGIGVDQLPEDIRLSKILTGNDLGMLGNVEEIPDETDVNEYKLMELSDLFMDFQDDAITLERKLHEKAHAHLLNGEVQDAWKTLLAFNDR